MDFKGNATGSGKPGASSADMADVNAPRYEYSASLWREKAG